MFLFFFSFCVFWLAATNYNLYKLLLCIAIKHHTVSLWPYSPSLQKTTKTQRPPAAKVKRWIQNRVELSDRLDKWSLINTSATLHCTPAAKSNSWSSKHIVSQRRPAEGGCRRCELQFVRHIRERWGMMTPLSLSGLLSHRHVILIKCTNKHHAQCLGVAVKGAVYQKNVISVVMFTSACRCKVRWSSL